MEEATTESAKTATLGSNFFNLEPDNHKDTLRSTWPPLAAVIQKVLRVNDIKQIYSKIHDRKDHSAFLSAVLNTLQIQFRISEEERTKIPATGPVIVMSNHPFGGMDGIILSAVLLSVRRDIKVMANYILSSIPELADLFIPVDPFGKDGSVRSNVTPLRNAIGWVERGGLLCVFPAGEVAHIHVRQGKVTDPEWPPMIARLVRKTLATVVPVYFHGANSVIFQLLGLVHPMLRTIMLPREFLKKSHKQIELRVGTPIPYEMVRHLHSDKDMMTFFRLRTYMLRNRKRQKGHSISLLQKEGGTNPISQKALSTNGKISPAYSVDHLDREISTLTPAQTLVEAGGYRILVAEARQIPRLLHEIGRLREITFRQVGEGTGKAVDLDRFDDHYLHMFLWHDTGRKLVGAYRLGLSDEIVKTHGIKGLYTRTLFQYRSSFLQQIGPAIELGRSFVRPEYQRSFHPLMLLWKGIARFVGQNPQYHLLFGPVSISRDYHRVSWHLMATYLKQNNFRADLASLIKAKKPLRKKRLGRREIQETLTYLHCIRDLSNLVSEIEYNEKGIPILLKHYLKLGAEILGFNVDRKFSGVLDALIILDLVQTDRKLLEKYMGKDEADAFLNYHSWRDDAAECA